ncbi:hypothetical protein FB451DRAFT_1372005 [Mycena latifolia]|nr:hypothetical protein FB451DRAFT_1372005 [Mycena latifolia]
MTRGMRRAKASPSPTRPRRSTRLQAKNNDEAPEIHSAHASPARDESPPWLGIEGSRYSAKGSQARFPRAALRNAKKPRAAFAQTLYWPRTRGNKRPPYQAAPPSANWIDALLGHVCATDSTRQSHDVDFHSYILIELEGSPQEISVLPEILSQSQTSSQKKAELADCPAKTPELIQRDRKLFPKSIAIDFDDPLERPGEEKEKDDGNDGGEHPASQSRSIPRRLERSVLCHEVMVALSRARDEKNLEIWTEYVHFGFGGFRVTKCEMVKVRKTFEAQLGGGGGVCPDERI